MGIPHLIATLERYATPQTIESEAVVIDGPALAYHILHVCRRNGVEQPGYGLLGRAVLGWLDKLTSNSVSIEAIYFDGYLPESKLPVRMERVVANTERLSRFHSGNSKGCLVSDVSSKADLQLDLFPVSQASSKVSLAPAFLVPTIIEALKQSREYSSLVHIVPGEADAFCAKHALGSGGLVLTSDSDLLIHDLGEGQVAFFRDIALGSDGVTSCLKFKPKDISSVLGLTSKLGLCRLGYEIKCQPQLSLGQIKQACLRPLDQGGQQDFLQFLGQYVEHEISPVPVVMNDRKISLQGLDPRVSEMALQLGAPATDGTTRIFLPHLMEDPERGTAWEPSMKIRQLAFSITNAVLSSRRVSIQEYRRAQNPNQKGRSVEAMEISHALEYAVSIMNTVDRLKGLQHVTNNTLWTWVCLVLDIRHCEEQGKYSFALDTLLPSTVKHTTLVNWHWIHLMAHIHASLYSLRILKQVLGVFTQEEMSTLIGPVLVDLSAILSTLPGLAEFPDIDDVRLLLHGSETSQRKQILAKFFQLPGHQVVTRDQSKGPVRGREPGYKRKRRRKAASNNAKPTASSSNMFDILSKDS